MRAPGRMGVELRGLLGKNAIFHGSRGAMIGEWGCFRLFCRLAWVGGMNDVCDCVVTLAWLGYDTLCSRR